MTRIYILSKDPLSANGVPEFFATKVNGNLLLTWMQGDFLVQQGSEWYFISDAPLPRSYSGSLISTSRKVAERLLSPFFRSYRRGQRWSHLYQLETPLPLFFQEIRNRKELETLGLSYQIRSEAYHLHAPFPVLNQTPDGFEEAERPLLFTSDPQIPSALQQFEWREVEDPASINWQQVGDPELLLSIPDWSLYDLVRDIQFLPHILPSANPPNSNQLVGFELEFLFYREDEFVPAYQTIQSPSYEIGLDGNSDIGEIRTHPSSNPENQIRQIRQRFNQLCSRYLEPNQLSAVFTAAREPGGPCGLHCHIGTKRKLNATQMRQLVHSVWDHLEPIERELRRDPSFCYRQSLGYGVEEDAIRLPSHAGFELRFFPATFGTPEGIRLVTNFCQQLSLSIIKDSFAPEPLERAIEALKDYARTTDEFIVR